MIVFATKKHFLFLIFCL